MTCREVEKLLPQLIDDALDEERRASVDEHVGSCSECGQLVRQLDNSLALFVAHQPDVQAMDTEKLWRRVRSEALEQPGGRKPLWSTVLVPALTTATAVVALAVIFWPSAPERGAPETYFASDTSSGPVEGHDAWEPAPPSTPADPSEASGSHTPAADAVRDAAPTVVAGAPVRGPEATPLPRTTDWADLPPGGTGSLPAVDSSPPLFGSAHGSRPVGSSAPPPEPAVAFGSSGLGTSPSGGTGSSPSVDFYTAAEPTEPTPATELRDYALVVAEWTVREYDTVVTFAEADDDLGDAEAEPVRTSLYAIVPSSYSVRVTECVYDAASELPALTHAETSPAEEPVPEDGIDTSDAGPVLGASVHTL